MTNYSTPRSEAAQPAIIFLRQLQASRFNTSFTFDHLRNNAHTKFIYAFHPGNGLGSPRYRRRAAGNEAGFLDSDSASTPSLGNGVRDWRR